MPPRWRTPDTRTAFADANIALVNDRWNWDVTGPGIRQDKIRPLAEKFFAALVDATIDSGITKMSGCPTATIEQWRAECIRRNLIGNETDRSDRSLFDKNKRELIAANWITCNKTLAWTL
jgi:hypothetical protein